MNVKHLNTTKMSRDSSMDDIFGVMRSEVSAARPIFT